MLDAPRVAGEETRRAIFAQPEWLRAVPTDRRLPEGRVLHTGCGTSFHAAQTAGWAEQALELVLRPRRADALVVVSHEGGTAVSLEAARAFDGPVWLVTGKPDSPLGEAADEMIVATFVLEGEGRAAERASGAVAALQELGCETTLVPTVHPVVDIVRFQLLTLELAAARGIDPDPIHRDDPRWERAAAAHG